MASSVSVAYGALWFDCFSSHPNGFFYICGRAANKLGVHDHAGIVWDEFVGLWVAMAFLPSTLASVICGFVLFRFFDIVKPWPIGWLDKKMHGGVGIMIDDIVAGFFAACIASYISYLGYL